MSAARPGFPFRIVLPLMQLLLCLGLLWPYLPGLSSHLRRAASQYSARILGTEPPPENSQTVVDVTPVEPGSEQTLDVDTVRLTAPAALNIPVGFLQIPFMLDDPSRSEWTPSGMWNREWRAVSWPFVGLIFWWIAGRSWEGIAAGVRFFASSQIDNAERQYRRALKVHWIELLIGMALAAVGGVSCYVLASGSGALGFARDYVLAGGAGLWAMLGLVIIIAGTVQWRVRKAERGLTQESAVAAEAE